MTTVRIDKSQAKGRTKKRPNFEGRQEASVMQTALQVDAFMQSPQENAHLLQLAAEADPPDSVVKDGDDADDIDDYDDVVQQTFPASDPPPPR